MRSRRTPLGGGEAQSEVPAGLLESTSGSWAPQIPLSTVEELVLGSLGCTGTSGSHSWTPQMLLDVTEELRTDWADSGPGPRGKGQEEGAPTGSLGESPWLGGQLAGNPGRALMGG